MGLVGFEPMIHKFHARVPILFPKALLRRAVALLKRHRRHDRADACPKSAATPQTRQRAPHSAPSDARNVIASSRSRAAVARERSQLWTGEVTTDSDRIQLDDVLN